MNTTPGRRLAPARLLFHQLSTEYSGRLCHLEVRRWQGSVKASMRRFFINPQGELYLTKDGIRYIVDQLSILRRLIPLIRRDFATAAQIANGMGAQEQESMDLILAHEHELQEEHAHQRNLRLHSQDEVNSRADSPSATPPASARIECDGDTSPEPRPSTSNVSPDIIPSATATTEEGLIIPGPKLKRKIATKRGSKKSKPRPDSEPTVVAVTRVHTKKSNNDSPYMGFCACCHKKR